MPTSAYRASVTASDDYAIMPTAFSTGAFFPCRITLLGHGLVAGWEFIQPIVITVERGDSSEFIASDDVFHMYGVGRSIGDSIKDYLAVVTEYYRHLSGDVDGPSIALFEYLRSYLRPING